MPAIMVEKVEKDFMNTTHKFENIWFEEQTDENKGISIITFNRPKVLNALNQKTLEELKFVLDEVKKSKSIRVLILTGAGEKAFVAGADISQFPSMTSKDARKFAAFGQRVFSQLEALDQPTLAAVNGFALGGGCELAAACDFIYASETAKFGQPEVNLGIIPGYGGTQRWVRQIGKAMAKELIFTGRIISAEEAFQIGFVNKVCAPDRLMNEITETARLIVSKGKIAVAHAKRAIDAGYHKELSKGLQIECEAFSKTFDTEDQKEGASAFLEKRQPRFQGR